MKTIIVSLFNYHEFNKVEFDFGDLFFKNIEDKIRYYWLIVEVERLDSNEILVDQDKWFEECKKEVKDIDFDKNTSLLIFFKREGSENERQNIFKIEEDPFQFKKYVLAYTDDSLANLKEKIEDDNSEKLLSLIVDDSVFNEYKETYENYSWHNLLYNIAHKLPFLKINVTINQNLENLFIKSKYELEKENLTGFLDSFDEVFSEEILEDFDKMNEDEVIELFNFNKDNGN